MQLSFWDLYSLFDKEYNSVIKEAAEKTGLTMNELGVLLFLSNNPSAKTASEKQRYNQISNKSGRLRMGMRGNGAYNYSSGR